MSGLKGAALTPYAVIATADAAATRNASLRDIVNALQQDFASHMIAWAMFLRVGGEPALSSLSLTPRKFASGLLSSPSSQPRDDWVPRTFRYHSVDYWDGIKGTEAQ
jgi:hypothetical protein